MARRYLTLEQLGDLPIGDMKTEWARRFGAPAPNISIDLLRLGIGYKLQEQQLGGLHRTTRSFLRHSERVTGKGTPPRKLTPGTKLIRDWHGVGHTVTVLHDGFDYDGRHWKSLTAIALAITGTKWNGPRFFGMSERRK